MANNAIQLSTNQIQFGSLSGVTFTPDAGAIISSSASGTITITTSALPGLYVNTISASTIQTSTFISTGLITANAGITSTTVIASGLITANAGVATTTISATGLVTASAGISTTTFLASGLITASGGITTTTLIASGLLTVAAITSSGLITANAGLTGTTITASGLITGAAGANITGTLQATQINPGVFILPTTASLIDNAMWIE